jgi:hypothetical protein
VKIDFQKRRLGDRIPLVVKVLYTAFVAVLVPKYWMDYGPTNFLYFCDVALLMTVPALWLENSLLASMALVGIGLAQVLWQIDYLGGLFGWHVIGMTAYMFDPQKEFSLRALSFFHFWLPMLLLYMVWRLGYDRRAFAGWTVVAIVLIFVCYFMMPAPPPPAGNPNQPVNINYVYGFSDEKVQTWMHPLAWVGLELVLLPVCLFLPAHLVLRRVYPEPVRMTGTLPE